MGTSKIIKKSLLMLLIATAVLFGVAIFENRAPLADKKQTVQEKQTPLLRVYFLNVGQGDAIYIRTPNGQDILIDGGPDNSVLSELGEVMPFWDREIDVMILTHPHNDHVTGLVEVLRRFKVNQIYYTGALHTAPHYLAWLEEIKKQKLKLNIVQDFFEVKFGDDLKLQFLYPQKNLVNQSFKELNDSSIVNRMVYKNVAYLFTGDASEKVEQELLKMGKDKKIELRSDVLKVGHHGSSSSSSESFLKAVNPKTAVIQSGVDNEFGHPHYKIIKRLERLGVKIIRNDENGMVEISTDGDQFDLLDD
ncbi:MAG: MBL fold metallo-hydrolase [Patescibacteria group bacterium]